MKIIRANKATFARLLGAWFALCLCFVPVQAEEVQYYHLDALGSAVAATDETGAVLWMESYEPFGERRERADGGTNSLWYTGKAEDTAIGLNYFGARWYNGRVGRFVAMDPVGVQEDNIHSFNRYAYANNNPYRFVDPDGRAVETALDVVSLGLSIAAFKSDPSFLNGLGVAYDGLATAVPFLPAGFGIIKNVGNGIDAVGDATKSAGGAANSAQGALLKEHLRQAEKYGKGGIKELGSGRTRYYGQTVPANKAGEMAGRRTVREWDPVTGNKRTWHETLDHSGNVRQVRPELNNGSKTHYTFDKNGNYTGSW